jgi:uncharacterized protein
MRTDETKFILKQASAVWAAYSCPGTAECCQLKVTQRLPYLWPSEWQVLLEDLRRQKRAIPEARSDGACPFLDAGGLRCTVYEARPFGCRTYFCHRIQGPAQVPADKTNALLERLHKLNIAHDSQANPKSILEWWQETAPAVLF